MIAEETVEGEAFEALFSDLPAKPAAYADLLARLRAAGINLPTKEEVEAAAEAAKGAKPTTGGAAAGQPA